MLHCEKEGIKKESRVFRELLTLRLLLWLNCYKGISILSALCIHINHF